MTLASEYIRKEDAEAVRSDLEDVFLSHIEDNFSSEIEERSISVKDAKKEASDRHEEIYNKIQKYEGVVIGFLSSFIGSIYGLIYAGYTLLFSREKDERQKLIDYFSYDQEEGDRVMDEYRKSWNKSMKNTITLFGVLFLVILRDVSPRFYRNSIGTLNRVFENEDVITGDDNWVRLVLRHSNESGSK